jgi:hypothetical protein
MELTYCQKYYREHREKRLQGHKEWRATHRAKAVEYENARRKRNPGITSYASMIQRCYNPDHMNFRNYGGKGVTVCSRWRHSFANFRDDMGPRPSGLTLDRIDPAGNYEPTNCRWATMSQQQRNKRK